MNHQIPDDWIDRIFGLMHEWYGERWTNQFRNDLAERLHKTVWKHGLVGLDYEQIKGALKHYRRMALRKPGCLPPFVMEFFSVAKSIDVPHGTKGE